MSQQTLTREYHGHTIVSVQCDVPKDNDKLPPEQRCDGWEHSVLGEVFQNLGVAIQHAKTNADRANDAGERSGNQADAPSLSEV